MQRDMNIFQTRGGYGASDVDKGECEKYIFTNQFVLIPKFSDWARMEDCYGEETGNKKHQACFLPV